MRRKDFENLPGLEVPEGYLLRTANLEDTDSLFACLEDAYPEVGWTRERTIDWLLGSTDVWAVFVVEHEDQIVATASCRELVNEPHTGYVHWVAVHSRFRGQHLGRLVTAVTLDAFRSARKLDVILETDDFRIPAIKTYLKLGFIPEPWDLDHQERWDALKPNLI
jgi:mycothiol synthase